MDEEETKKEGVSSVPYQKIRRNRGGQYRRTGQYLLACIEVSLESFRAKMTRAKRNRRQAKKKVQANK